jgi:HK97 family phage portal protein
MAIKERKFNLFNFMERKMAMSEIVAQKLADQLAFKELALFIGVSLIANTLSKCEFKTYENGKEVKNKQYYMLNISPNPNQNSSQFINKFIEQYYYQGQSLVVPHKKHIYCADSFDIDDSNPLVENTFYNVTFGNQQPKTKYRANEVFYIQLDNRKVKSLIDSMYLEYSEIIAQALATFKRTNGTRYKLMLERYQAGDPEFKKIYDEGIKKGLESFTQNNNSIYIQNKGVDLQEFSSKTPTNSSDIIAMRKEIFEVVAQALKIPLPMMYGNITNMNEIVKVYLSLCIDPLADMIGEEFTRKYYSFEEWQGGNYVKVDTSCINHIDIFEVADKVAKIVSSAAMNVDELRDRLGMNALNTEFSTAYWMTKNFALAEDMLTNAEGRETE